MFNFIECSQTNHPSHLPFHEIKQYNHLEYNSFPHNMVSLDTNYTNYTNYIWGALFIVVTFWISPKKQ